MDPFDLFVTSKEHGWGLGLATVRQIIIAHDGTIDYTSELGRGTTFKISLPLLRGDLEKLVTDFTERTHAISTKGPT